MKPTVMLLLMLVLPVATFAQDKSDDDAELKARMAEEAKIYFKGADTARCALKYDFRYLFDRKRRLTHNEQRLVIAADTSTVDMIADKRKGTPSFYFYFPRSRRMTVTYRVVGEEFLIDSTTVENEWLTTGCDSIIGDYVCRKATALIGGRQWTAWYTDDIAVNAAPRRLVGLPGVVVYAYDSEKEIEWRLKEVVEKKEGDMLFVKLPTAFSAIPRERLEKVRRIFALSKEATYVQKSGVEKKYANLLPERLYPNMGIDACNVTNPIDIE
ncbi:MAG: GLPGLI family protein [Prevotella sp.]